MAQDPLISTSTALSRGLACKCPRCGEGRLFSGILKPAKSCAACGLDYSFFDTGDGAAVFAIMIIGFFATGSALYAHFVWHWPVWAHIIIWPLFVLIFGTLIQRPIKGCLITLHYANRAGIAQFEGEDE